MSPLAPSPAPVDRGKRPAQKDEGDPGHRQVGRTTVDRRLQTRIAHAMAKIQNGARTVREGHAELATAFRALKAKGRAPAAADVPISLESSLGTVGHANAAEGRL